MDNNNYQILINALGQEKAEKVVKLTNKYDKFVSKFKSEVNDLLGPMGYEVLTGVTFVSKIEMEAKRAADKAAQEVILKAQQAQQAAQAEQQVEKTE